MENYAKNFLSCLQVREGTYDKQIITEVLSSYNWLDLHGKTILDLGACFGAATGFFVFKAAKKVISVEADVDNFKLLKKNTRNWANVELINAAVTYDKKDTVDFWISKGINKGSHTLFAPQTKRIYGAGRERKTVAAVQFKELLKKYKPQAIKIDIEGGEYEILREPLPVFVKQVVMEIHFTNKKWKEEEAPRILKLFEDWQTVQKPNFDKGRRITLGGFKR